MIFVQQGDHDADGDHFPNSPGASASSRGGNNYESQSSRTSESYRLSRGSSHQHEHFEMASIPTTRHDLSTVHFYQSLNDSPRFTENIAKNLNRSCGLINRKETCIPEDVF